MADDIFIDGTQLSWQAFADRLIALRNASEQGPLPGYVRAPRGCERETRRLIRHLDLTECIAMLGPAPVQAKPMITPPPRPASLFAALLAWLGIVPLGSRPSQWSQPRWD